MSIDYTPKKLNLNELFGPEAVQSVCTQADLENPGALSDTTYKRLTEALNQNFDKMKQADKLAIYQAWNNLLVSCVVYSKAQARADYGDEVLAPRLKAFMNSFVLFSDLVWTESEFNLILDTFTQIILSRQDRAQESIDNGLRPDFFKVSMRWS